VLAVVIWTWGGGYPERIAFPPRNPRPSRRRRSRVTGTSRSDGDRLCFAGLSVRVSAREARGFERPHGRAAWIVVSGPITYREGGPLDLGDLQRLLDQTAWARGRSKDGLSRMLAHSSFVFTAWDGPLLVGFARVLTDQVYRATLWDVVVDAPYQGRGVGDGLVECVLAHPVLSRVEKFWLNTRDKRAFYERFGFVPSSQGMVLERPRSDGPGRMIGATDVSG